MCTQGELKSHRLAPSSSSERRAWDAPWLGGAEQLARGAVPGTVSEGQLARWQGARAELMVIKNPALLALSPPADQEGKLIFFAISFTTG